MKVLVFHCRKVLEIKCRKLYVFACCLQNEAFNNLNSNKSLYLGQISEEKMNKLRNDIQSISEEKRNTILKKGTYSLEIGQEDIRHCKKESMSIGKLIDYITNLPKLVMEYDSVHYNIYSASGNEYNALRFKKKFRDGEYISLEIVSKKKHLLATHNIFIEKSDFEKVHKNRNFMHPANANMANSETSETRVPSVSNNSISNNSENDNNVLNQDRNITTIAEELGVSERFLSATLEGGNKESALSTLKRNDKVREKFLSDLGLKIEPVLKEVESSYAMTNSIKKFVKNNNVSFQTLEKNEMLRNEYANLIEHSNEKKESFFLQKVAKKRSEDFLEDLKKAVEGDKKTKSRIERELQLAKGEAEAYDDGYALQRGQDKLLKDKEKEFEKFIYSKINPLFDAAENIKKEFEQNVIDNNDEYVEKAEKYYGITDDYSLAAYIDTNGKMIDFSSGGNIRGIDHRGIAEILDTPDEVSGTEALTAFMNAGNVRIMGNGIDVSVKPNSKQKSVIRGFVDSRNGEIYIDFSKADGSTDGSAQYSKGTSSGKIIADIDEYFRSGTLPENTYNSISDFLYQDRIDAEGNSYIEITDDILEGVPENEYETKVKEVLTDIFSEGVAYRNNIFTMNRDDKRHLIRSKSMTYYLHNNNAIRLDILRMSKYADEIIKSANNWINLEKKYSNTSNAHLIDFAHGFINLSVFGNDYSIKVVVGIDKKGYIHLYDFSDVKSIKIKKETNTDAHSNRKVIKFNDLSENNVSQGNKEVNNSGDEWLLKHERRNESVKSEQMTQNNGIASYTEERLENLYDYYVASNENYSKAYLTRMSPEDFLLLTTSDSESYDRIISESRKLDKEELANNSQPIYLWINNEGEVEEHEGRHRMAALMNAGINSVPVVLINTSNKYGKQIGDIKEVSKKNLLRNVLLI